MVAAEKYFPHIGNPLILQTKEFSGEASDVPEESWAQVLAFVNEILVKKAVANKLPGKLKLLLRYTQYLHMYRKAVATANANLVQIPIEGNTEIVADKPFGELMH